MIREEYRFEEDELHKKLLPLLEGHIFHCTSIERAEKIIEMGLIKSNKDGNLGCNWSKNSYGRKRGYVCLFNLKAIEAKKVRNAIECLNFLNLRPFTGEMAYFVLKDKHAPELISSEQAKSEKTGELYIPNVEHWYPGDLPLTMVERILFCRINLKPLSDFVKAVSFVAL